MSGVHHLRVTKDADFDPDWPSWDYEVTCVEPDKCEGWWECQKEHRLEGIEVADISAAAGPYENDCPGWHGPHTDPEHDKQMEIESPQHWPWCEEDEFEFHGELHTWRTGWGWTVKYPGCVVVSNDGVCDSAYDIGQTHGEGLYLVDDDWYDESDVNLIYVSRVEE